MLQEVRLRNFRRFENHIVPLKGRTVIVGPDEVVERYQQAEAAGIRLHVWARKEIENYLLVPQAISRVITHYASTRSPVPTPEEIGDEIHRLAASLLDRVTDDCATHYQSRRRGTALKTANAWARRYVAQRLAEDDGLIGIAPGKILIGELSDWANRQCGVTFGPAAIARELPEDEMVAEFRTVLVAVRENRQLPSSKDLWVARIVA